MFPNAGIISRAAKTLFPPSLGYEFLYYREENLISPQSTTSTATDTPMDFDEEIVQRSASLSLEISQTATSTFEPTATSVPTTTSSHLPPPSNSSPAPSAPPRIQPNPLVRTQSAAVRDLDTRGIKHRDFAFEGPKAVSQRPEQFYVKDQTWAYEIELLENPERTEPIHPKRLFRLVDSGYYRLEEEKKRWNELEKAAFSEYVRSPDAKRTYQAIWGYYPGSLCKTWMIGPLELKRTSDPSKAPRWVRPEHPHLPGHSTKEPAYFDTPPPGELATPDDRYQLMRLWLKYKTHLPPRPLEREETEPETDDEGVEEDEEARQTLIQRLEQSADENLPELRGRRYGGAYTQPPTAAANPRALRRDRAIVAPSEPSGMRRESRHEWQLEDLVDGGRVGDILKGKGKRKSEERDEEEGDGREMKRRAVGFGSGFGHQGVETPGAGPSQPSTSTLTYPPPLPPPSPNSNRPRGLALTRTYASVWQEL